VEANNRIRELESEERREIIRILTEFADYLRPFLPDLSVSYDFLAEIDFIRAKARFALQINAIKPPLENRPLMDWVTSRPLRCSICRFRNKIEKSFRSISPSTKQIGF